MRALYPRAEMIRYLVAAIALILPTPGLRAQSPPITVFVVRHAEKGAETPDPSLTVGGQRRAEELARVLGDASISALFASEFKRTQETLAPIGRALRLSTTVIPTTAMDTLIARIRALKPGARALVASHSNLVDLIVERLTGATVPPLTDRDYDRLVVVTITGEHQGTAIVLRFGER